MQKMLGIVVASFLLWNVCFSEIVTRTFRWTNLNDFLTAGWTPAEYAQNLTTRWDSPIDLDSNLANLSDNFTDEVWGMKGITAEDDTNRFRLFYKRQPEYCGLINATLQVKIYFSGNETRNYMFPVLGEDDQNFFIPSPVVKWQTYSGEIDVPRDYYEYAQIRIYARVGDFFIFDEVSFTYSAQQDCDMCPHLCN